MTDSRTRRLHQQAELLLNANRHMEARALYDQICALDASDAEAFMMRGALDGEMGKVEDALQSLNEAIRLNPGYANAYHTLAHLLQHQGKLAQAREALQKAVEIDPEFTEAWSRLGAVLAQLERFDEAIPALETALHLNPSDNQVRTTLGYAYHGNKAFAKAAEQFHRIIESNPDEAQAWAALARVTEEDGWQAQADFCECLAERFPGNRHITLNHGYALEMLNDVDGAGTKYEQVTREFPEWGEGWNRLGMLHVRLEQSQEASNFLKKAIDCGVGSPLTLCMYGAALRVCGNLKEAEHYCRLAMGKAPDLVPVYTHLGLVQTEMGELDLALETYRKGLDLDPGNPTLISGVSDVLERQGNPEGNA